MKITRFLPLLILLTACSTGASPAQTSTAANNSLIVQSLTPICASTLKDQKVIPAQARSLGIDEKAVCECGIAKVETKFSSNPALLIDVFRSTDAQIKLLVEVGADCSGELLKKALLNQLQPSPVPGTTSGYPSPSPTPSYYPNPAPTFWPPSGP